MSCVTKDSPHRPHPHAIVSKDKSDRGIYTHQTDAQVVYFPNLGVQCVKKKNVKEALEKREELRIDPFDSNFFKNNLLIRC